MADLEERLRQFGRTAPLMGGAPGDPSEILHRARQRRQRKLAVTSVALVAALVALTATVMSREDRVARLATTPPANSTTTLEESTMVPPTSTASTDGPATGTAPPIASPAPHSPAPAGQPSPATSMPTTTAPATTTTTSAAWPVIADPCGRSTEPSARAASRSPDGRIWIALDHGAVGTSDDRARTWTWTCDALRIAENPLPTPVALSARTTTAAWAVIQLKDRPGKALVDTADGGRNWRTIDLPLDDVDGVAAIDDTTGIAWGRRNGAPALLRWTQIGGWRDAAASIPGPISRAVFPGEFDGWITGTRTGTSAGYVLATTDGGTTWHDITPPGAGPVSDAARGSNGFGCVLLPDALSCSTDGGATWATKARADVRTSRVGIYRDDTVLLAMPAGQMRWYGPGGSGGQTITDTDGQVRAFAVEWGRYVVINSDDGWIDIESTRDTGLEWYPLWHPRGSG